MNTIFVVAGIVVAVIGIAAIAIVSGIYIAVKFLGAQFTFGNKEDEQDRTR